MPVGCAVFWVVSPRVRNSTSSTGPRSQDSFFSAVKTKVIAFCGRATSGKTTAAEWLEGLFRARSQGARIIPFAKPLKDKARELGWNGVKDEKGRALLQRLGTDVCRECIDEDYWVDAWMKEYNEAQQQGIQWVLTDDMRFGNELQAVRDLNAHVIKIVRPQGWLRETHYTLLHILGRVHPSEVGFCNEEVDQILVNDGSLTDFYWKAYAIHKQVTARKK